MGKVIAALDATKGIALTQVGVGGRHLDWLKPHAAHRIEGKDSLGLYLFPLGICPVPATPCPLDWSEIAYPQLDPTVKGQPAPTPAAPLPASNPRSSDGRRAALP